MNRPTKVLLLCVDSADPTLIADWAAAGQLPTWRSLLDDGYLARVENSPGLYTGAVWPSFYTGLMPGRHGRYFYRQIATGSYDIAPFAATDVKGEPFWNALGQAQRRVAVIDVPKAPLSSTPNVVQVADWGTHDPDYDGIRSAPAALATELTARFGREPVGICDDYQRTVTGLRSLRDRLLERIVTKEAMLTHSLGQGGWDLFIGGFSEGHCAGHQFWHLHDPAHPRHNSAEADALGDPLLSVYQAIDGALGRLIARAGPDTPLFVYASHGMAAHYDATFLLDEVLRRLDGRPASAGQRMLRALKPIWRSLPQRWRDAGRGLADTADETTKVADRRQRRWFLIPTNDNCAGIRINLRGREPNGLVSPGAEYDAVCDGLATDLTQLVNADTGAPAVRAVHRADQMFPGPYRQDLPDIVVQWHREAPFSGLASAKVGEVRDSYRGYRTGDHRPDGLFIARGPAIRPGQAGAAVVDLAPTIAAALGVALDDVDGEPIAGLAAEVSRAAMR